MRALLILLWAIGSGAVAGSSALRMARPVPALSPAWTVVSIESSADGARIELDDGRTLHIETLSDSSNARNLELLYEGKTVLVAAGGGSESARACSATKITPSLQQRPRRITGERHRELVAAGFSDADIAVSYALDAEAAASGIALRVHGAGERYEAPGVCATRR